MQQRFSVRPPAGIRLGDWIFTEPIPIHRCVLSPHNAGMFVILVPDPTWSPRPFQPLFFGEFGAHHPKPVTQDEYVSWFRAAAGKDIYAAVHEVPLWQTAELPRVRRELIRAYQPLCHRDSCENAADEIVRKLDAIDRRNQEHEALLRVLLAAVGRAVEPPLIPPKRQIGFKPDIDAPPGPFSTRL